MEISKEGNDVSNDDRRVMGKWMEIEFGGRVHAK